MEVNEPQKDTDDHKEAEGDEEGANHRKLDEMINDLSKSLWGVKNEQEYMQVNLSFSLYEHRNL